MQVVGRRRRRGFDAVPVPPRRAASRARRSARRRASASGCSASPSIRPMWATYCGADRRRTRRRGSTTRRAGRCRTAEVGRGSASESLARRCRRRASTAPRTARALQAAERREQARCDPGRARPRRGRRRSASSAELARSASSSMKLAYRSPILRASLPWRRPPAAASSTIARTSRSACVREHAERAVERPVRRGSRCAPSHAPLTWPNRSSCGRTARSMSSTDIPDLMRPIVGGGRPWRQTTPRLRMLRP